MRDRRIDLDRLLRERRLPLGRQRTDGSHIVQSICQLDDDDSNVVGHREQHLAQTLRLPVFPVGQTDLAQLCDPIYTSRHIKPKRLAQIIRFGCGVFQSVMQ